MLWNVGILECWNVGSQTKPSPFQSSIIPSLPPDSSPLNPQSEIAVRHLSSVEIVPIVETVEIVRTVHSYL